VPEPALPGRQGEARRNDAKILAAARAVFVANPDAPIAAVAEQAGVNIASLYRRFASKEDVLRRLCHDGLLTYVEIARRAVEALEALDPWDAFVTFMKEIVEADTLALTVKLAGRFQPTEEMAGHAVEAFTLNERIVARVQAAGALRGDVDPNDLSYIFEQVSCLRAPTPERTTELRSRYLTLHLDALRAPGRTPLPGPPPSDDDVRARWRPRK
jgi:AcrR family transcriptional regulator